MSVSPRGVGYWRTHNKYAAQRANRIPWPIDEDTPICGMTFLNILKTPPKGDPWLKLAQQWIAAMLNANSGADLPDEVLAPLGEAEALLRECRVSPFELDLYYSLASELEAYNEGRLV